MSSARTFFAGVGTTVLLIGAGFGGGLMLARTAMDSVPQNRAAATNRLPAARVILPALAEAATPPSTSVRGEEAVPASSREVQQSQLAPPKEIQAWPQPSERESQAGRPEKKRVEAEERDRRKRHAEKKARREAARAQQQEQQEVLRQRLGIVAFGGDPEQSRSGGFFGN
jgi:hypothetical protein